MAQSVSIAWLGHRLNDYRAQVQYDPEQHPQDVLDGLVFYLSMKLEQDVSTYGTGDDLDRAYSIGGNEDE